MSDLIGQYLPALAREWQEPAFADELENLVMALQFFAAIERVSDDELHQDRMPKTIANQQILVREMQGIREETGRTSSLINMKQFIDHHLSDLREEDVAEINARQIEVGEKLGEALGFVIEEFSRQARFLESTEVAI